MDKCGNCRNIEVCKFTDDFENTKRLLGEVETINNSSDGPIQVIVTCRHYERMPPLPIVLNRQ